MSRYTDCEGRDSLLESSEAVGVVGVVRFLLFQLTSLLSFDALMTSSVPRAEWFRVSAIDTKHDLEFLNQCEESHTTVLTVGDDWTVVEEVSAGFEGIGHGEDVQFSFCFSIFFDWGENGVFEGVEVLIMLMDLGSVVRLVGGVECNVGKGAAIILAVDDVVLADTYFLGEEDEVVGGLGAFRDSLAGEDVATEFVRSLGDDVSVGHWFKGFVGLAVCLHLHVAEIRTMGNITRALGDIASYGVGVIPHHRGLAGLRLRRSVASRRLGFAFGEDAGRSKFGFRLEAKFLVASLDAFATFVALRFGDNSELILGLGSGSLVGVRVQ